MWNSEKFKKKRGKVEYLGEGKCKVSILLLFVFMCFRKGKELVMCYLSGHVTEKATLLRTVGCSNGTEKQCQCCNCFFLSVQRVRKYILYQ